MPQGDKSAYTDKQKRQVKHIEEGYEKKGVPKDEAKRRAWATENKLSPGAEKNQGRARSLKNIERPF
jgi:plasmid stabilization system protein ParE